MCMYGGILFGPISDRILWRRSAVGVCMCGERGGIEATSTPGRSRLLQGAIPRSTAVLAANQRVDEPSRRFVVTMPKKGLLAAAARLNAAESDSAPAIRLTGKKRVSDDLGAAIFENSLKVAKQRVIEAMDSDPQLAFQMQYLVDSKKLDPSRQKKEKVARLQPSCNKWMLLPNDRCAEVLTHLSATKCPPPMMGKVPVDTKRGALCWALCLERSSALPTKVWPDLLDWADERHAAMGHRLQHIIWEADSNDSAKLAANYEACGCFTLIKNEDGLSWGGVRHLNGTFAGFAEPLDLHYYIEDNHHEMLARVCSPRMFDCQVFKFFELAGKGHFVLVPLALEKVHASSSKDMICDKTSPRKAGDSSGLGGAAPAQESAMQDLVGDGSSGEPAIPPLVSAPPLQPAA